MATILVYGDSNSHGTAPLTELGQSARHPKGQRWPEAMAAHLGAGHTVISEGLPGRTTVHDDPVEGGNRNGLALFSPVLLSHVPLDLLIVMLGTNDLKNRFAVTAFEIARSAERLVTEARAILPGIPVLLICPAPVQEAGVLSDVFAGAEARQVGLAAYMAEAATRAGAAFLDAGAHVTVSPIDGVHWAPEDHLSFGKFVATQIADLLPLQPDSPAGSLARPDPDAPNPPVTLARTVPRDWGDYNGHMNEAYYLAAFSDACDQMLLWSGMDADCVAKGHSVFTVETHIRHLGEVAIGDRIEVRTRVLEGGGKKLHIWQDLSVGEQLCATAEQLLLHMDLTQRRSAPPPADVAAFFARLASAHAPLPAPEGLGRHVGQRN